MLSYEPRVNPVHYFDAVMRLYMRDALSVFEEWTLGS